MSNRAIRRLFGGLGTVLVLILCGVLIAAHFLTGRNLQRVDVQKYVDVGRDSAGEFTFTLDVDRMLKEEHLNLPKETDAECYPEIAALETLGVRAAERNGAYEIETISSSSDTHFNETLKKGGIRLTNTQWTWTKEQAAARLGTQPAGVRTLRYPDYIVISRTSDGSFRADLDKVRLLRDAGIGADTDANTDPGAKALNSLGIMCQKKDGVYLLQATSTDVGIESNLTAANLQINERAWTWTDAEMEAHIGTLETPAPTETPVATEATESLQPEETPQTTPPETHETPSPTAEPTAAPTEKPERQGIDTLYGFDQTDVRKAIRAAKEAHYGSKLESSEVIYNCFAVGGADAEHANVFRIVYKITKSTGSDYLIADVYDLENETGYTANDVHLTVANDSGKAKSTDDLKGYTIHKLEGGSMVFEENSGKSPFDSDGLVMAKSLTDKLSYSELWDIPQTKEKTLYQLLGFARNEMFARGGLKFKSTSIYTKYYSQFSWYKPTGSVTVDDLAKMYPMTRTNIETIRYLEKLILEG